MDPNTKIIRFFLLRGLARESRHWGTFPSALMKTVSNCQIIPLEIPGSGTLCRTPSPKTIIEHVESVRNQYVEKVGSGGLNVVIGFSFGGMVAAQWLHSFPLDIQAGILINTSSKESPPLKRMKPGGALRLASTLFATTPHAKEVILARLLCNLADTSNVADHWCEIRKSAPVSISSTCNQLIAAASFSLPQKLQQPILILGSKKDRLVEPTCSEDIAGRWCQKVVYHPEAGHDMTTDDPHWCADTIFTWLKHVSTTIIS